MQLTMEPLDEMLESARVMDEAGIDTIWLAEAYPWWRKHGMEARSSTVVSALMARETERLTIGWGIISPFTRHPVQVAMDARVVQEAAGPGRFLLGFGTSKIFLNNAQMQTNRTLGPMRDAVDHDACLRPLYAGKREVRHRHRLHRGRIDRRGSRRRTRRCTRDRGHVPREQVPEHQGRCGHAARSGRDQDGGAPAGGGGDGTWRAARGQGGSHGRPARSLQADRRHARR